MTIVKSYYKSVLFLILALVTNLMFGQSELRKEIKKTFDLSNGGALYLENKYGDVHISGWEKDAIQIEVNIEAKGKNESKAKELLDRLNPSIIATNRQIIIKSEIVKKETSFINRYINKIDPFKKANAIISYKIHLPKHAEIDVYNKYGDIFISNWKGKLKAEVEYGSINSKETLSNSKINIRHGDVNLETIINSTIKAKEALLSITFGKDLKINSNGSEINIGTMEGLDLTSNKDKIEINTVNGIFGSIEYSTVLFRNIENRINLDLNSAELKVLKLNKIPTINISQTESEVYLNISETNFAFNAKLEQGVLRIPKTMKNIESDVLDKRRKLREISASYGGVRIGNIAFTGVKGVIILKEL